MASEKTRAIVLRVIEFSESSCVVTLFTLDFGKVGALAKGARRPKSAFEGALELLALVRIVFLRKSSDALDLLTEGKLGQFTALFAVVRTENQDARHIATFQSGGLASRRSARCVIQCSNGRK
jgi:recombinational DNA repair protein (RecF pathway)